ncbi:BgTH12-02119 [Blumeria graminis f. sp. triticale]|uniref:BgTH12-02119 n=1 Tax=Blumeria graminis f. sp. triticale TaxID=1689686 RepID=A0A9W4D039_BLUGR|nr:BgTH12-02119 [Blumeria graminis f. sp. triticale]
MKISLSLYLTFTTLQVFKIGATFTTSDYLCGKDFVSHRNIKISVEKACDILYRSKERLRFPAVYDASTTFFISDARLFSWPVMLNGRLFHKGRPGTFRVIVDSSCRFVGVIMKYHNSPDQRCFQPVELPRQIDDSSTSGPRNLPILRGYNCRNQIFDLIDVERDRETSILQLRGWQSQGQKISLTKLDVVDRLFETPSFLLPSMPVTHPSHIRDTLEYIYLTVIDSQDKTLGMVHKTEDKWEKCDGLWEVEPVRRQSLVPGQNSIGETVFHGVSGYQCGKHKFTRESINSHMQLACKILEKSQPSIKKLKHTRFEIARIATGVETLTAWKFPLQLAENAINSRHYAMNNKCVVVLDQRCNFYGAYQNHFSKIIACDRLSPHNLPEISGLEVSTPDFSWIDEFMENGPLDSE